MASLILVIQLPDENLDIAIAALDEYMHDGVEHLIEDYTFNIHNDEGF